MRHVATALVSSIEPPGWSRMAAARCTTVSTPAQRVAKRRRVGEVAEGDLHAHALGAQAPRVAHQAAHRAPGGGQARQQRGADEAGGAGEQQHAAAFYRSRAERRRPRAV